ncbi:MAG TPA: hypothetical protein VIL30_17785 [Ramlibacter sp.]|jgi:hypothetical protein
MPGIVRTTWVGTLLRVVPAPVLRLLDAWSYRVAQRRALQRQERWARRQAGAASRF